MTETPTLRRWALILALLGWLGGASVLATPLGPDAEPGNIKKPDSAGHSLYDQPPEGPELGAQRLDVILAELELPTQAALSLWDRIRQWLEETFGNRSASTIPDWLQDFRLSETTAQWIFYLSCALIVILSVAIIANELRHARARRRVREADALGVAEQSRGGTQTALPRYGLFDMPAYLLERLIARLLPDPTTQRALTHRELLASSERSALQDRQPLIRIALLAEQIRYARRRPPADEVETAVAQARALLEALDARHE